MVMHCPPISHLLLACAAGVCLCITASAPTWAQDEDPAANAQTAPSWTSEAGVSLVSKTGNTRTNDIGVTAKVKRQAENYRQLAELTFDYGDQSGLETKRRLFTNYELDVSVTDRWFAFGSGTYTDDAFDGYDYRATANVGAGVDILANDIAEWSVRGGPGLRTETVTDTGEDTTELSVVAASRYARTLNDAVSMGVDTRATWTNTSTTVLNTAQLTAKLNSTLSARFGYDVQYESNPPAGAKATDTTIRFALVFSRKPA